ncbi:MAG: pilus assembly protein N-terminal domain-containing protein [Acidobacteriaceae bacterium]|jgi:pilus assembly protein CpaC
MRRAETDAQAIHVTVGHSFFLDTKARLRKVYIADPAVLDSITLSPNEIIVTAMTPGITSLILLDEDGHAQSYVVSSDIDVEGLRAAMSQAMRGDAVSVLGRVGRIVLSGKVTSSADSDAAFKLASLYSKDVANALTVTPVHPKQVRLQVRILEVDRSKALELGINLFNPGGNTSFLAGATTGQFPSAATLTPSSTGGIGTLTTTNALNFMFYSAKLNLGETLQDLQSKQVLQILAEPTITTISGQTANFLSGGQFPFPVVQPGSGAGSTSVVTIQFREYGVKVEFTPVVNEDGTIRMKVAPEVSALDYTNSVTIGGSTIPALSTRKAETEVELRSNQSFAISGLLDQRTTDIMSKTPGAASIPIIGNLFKSKNANHSTTELIVVVTPTVVDPLSDTTEPKQPDLPIPTLDTHAFDKSLGKNLNPTPTAPPLRPGQPYSSDQTPAPPAAVVTPATQVSATPVAVPAPIAAPALVAAPPPVPEVSAAPVVAPAMVLQNAPDARASHPALVVGGRSPQPAALIQPARAAAAPAVPVNDDQQPPLVATASAPVSAPAQFSAPAVLIDAPVASIAVPTAMAPALDAAPQDFGAVAVPDTDRLATQTSGRGTHPMVQIMALSNKQDADAMVTALKRHGYNVAVSRDPQDSMLHLEVGPFADNSTAQAMRQRLVLEGYNATVK